MSGIPEFPIQSTADTLNAVATNINTVGGFDKALALVQYSAKLVLLYNKNYRKNINSAAVSNLIKIISDTRTVFRFRGSFPLMAKALLSSKSKSKDITTIQKLQLLAMLLYYPLEHTYWLGSLQILPIKPTTVVKSARYSGRAWLAYNLLEIINLAEESRKLIREKGKKEFELKDVSEDKRRLVIKTFSTLCFTLMSLHFSLESSPFSSDLIDVTGFLAAVANYL